LFSFLPIIFYLFICNGVSFFHRTQSPRVQRVCLAPCPIPNTEKNTCYIVNFQ
jgi:hypothetical protein